MTQPALDAGTAADALAGSAPLQGLTAVAAACASGDAAALFASIDTYLRPVLGQTLCTVNRFDAQRMAVVRLYSSDAAAYPPGGAKDKRGMPWGQHVLIEQQVYVGEGVEAIRSAFDDHAAIIALGLKSVINVPVVAAGTCLGTLNLLMPHERVQAEHVALARLGGLLSIPGFGFATRQ